MGFDTVSNIARTRVSLELKLPTYNSIVSYVGDGSRVLWDFDFAGGYIAPEHVKVVINGVPTTATLVSPGTVAINPPVPAGQNFTIERHTPKDTPLADFARGANITELNLDNNAKQGVFVAAEAIDRFSGLSADFSRNLSVPVGEVAPPLPARAALLGKALGVDLLGNFVGIELTPDGSLLGTTMITHGGTVLSSVIDDALADLNALDASVEDQAGLLIDLTTAGTATQAQLTALQTDFTALEGVVADLTALGEGDSVSTLVANEASARIAGDNALAATIAIVGAASDGNTAFILDINKVKVSPTTTLASRFSTLDASLASNSAAITSETNARIAGDSAEASARATLAATLRNETDTKVAAAVQTESTARATAIAAEASARATLAATLRGETDSKVAAGVQTETIARTNALSTETSNRNAAIAAETAARNAAISAEASARTTLQTQVNGQSATITALQSSVNGTRAKYTLTLNVNGHITGFTQESTGTTGSFTITTDTFRIVSPGGGTPIVPFEVTGEGVRINGNLVVSGTIKSDRFNLSTMVRRSSTNWSGSSVPALDTSVRVAVVSLGELGVDGSTRLDYDLRYQITTGQQTTTHMGLPLYTTYVADGFVLARVIHYPSNTVVAQASDNGYGYQGSPYGTYTVTHTGQIVLDRTGPALSECFLEIWVRRGATNSGIINDGDYYIQQISATYNLQYGAATAKWTFI